MSFRNYADLLKLRELLAGGLKTVVIVGAGLLGLELAESLLKRNCQVKMVDNQQMLLSRNLDADGSEFFSRQLGKVENLSFFLGRSLQEILPGKTVLSDGTVLESELVIFSAGTRPVFPVLAGAAPGTRLEVDLQMRTAFDHVFAAGDVAASPVPNPGLYLPARDMGQVAGTVAGGGDAHFKKQESPVRFAAFGVKVFSCGQISTAVRSVDLSTESKYCREFYSADDRLQAVVLIGDVSAATSYLEKLKA
jgi:NAD(P)H-nitrite reductase large subunit